MKKKQLWRAGCAAILTTALVIQPLAGRSMFSETHVATAAVAEEEAGVVFDHESGVYEKEFSLGLSASQGYTTIYYTTDGSDPSDANSSRKQYINGTTKITVTDRKGDKNVLAAVDPELFDAAHVEWDGSKFKSKLTPPGDEDVDKITVVKAVAVDGAGNYSPVVTNSYFVGAMTDHIQKIRESCQASGMDLSVMSISMEYDDLFDPEYGIYVRGNLFDRTLKNYVQNHYIQPGDSLDTIDVARKEVDANYKQKGRDWEREAHIDYFESNGERTEIKLQQDCGIRIQGNYSRSDYQKSFRLYARTDYGKKNFKYPFFGDSLTDDEGNVMKKFKKLNLRSGGNAAFTVKYTDAYWQSLIGDLKCETQASRACVVYLNGEYWGVYVLQEDYNDDYIEETHGIDNGDVVIYKGQDHNANGNGKLYKMDEGSLPAGVDDEDYYIQDLFDFIDSHQDLSKQKDYEEFCKIMDVESLRDYFAVQVWINNKWDWPIKNWSMWKATRTDSNNPYADGRWRFLFYDLDFGGCEGADDIYVNTIENDGYRTNGLLNPDTNLWIARIFACAMTNKSFRDDFAKSLSNLSINQFHKQTATEALEVYKGTYEPLLWQFFDRFPGVTSADDEINVKTKENSNAIRAFLADRGSFIPEILDWVSGFYGDTPVLYAGEYLKVTGSWMKTGEDNQVDVLMADGFNATAKSAGGGYWFQVSGLALSSLEEPMLEVRYEANDNTLQVQADTTGINWEHILTIDEENSGVYRVSLDKGYKTLYITSDGYALRIKSIRIYDAEPKAPPKPTPPTPAQTPGGSGGTTPSPTPGGSGNTTPSPTPGGSGNTTPSPTPGGSGNTTPSPIPGGNGDTTPTSTPGGDSATDPNTSASPAPGGTGDDGAVTQPPAATQDPDTTATAVKVKKVALKKVKASKKAVVVQWGKLSGVTGYEVQIATKKNFKKGLKKYTVKKAATVKKNIKKLESNKKYFVRVRAYKTVSGTKYTGSWSKVKSVKVK